MKSRVKPNDNGIIIHYISKKCGIVPEYANIHTHGMEKYKLPNLCLAVGYDKKKATHILNTVSDCIIKDNKFNFDLVHCFDEPDGNGSYRTYMRVMFKKVVCCDEEAYLIILLNDDNTISDYQNMHPEKWEDIKLNDDWMLDIDGCRYVFLLNNNGEYIREKLAKLVFETFNDELDLSGDWDVGYKDGDFTNCALENLYLIKE